MNVYSEDKIKENKVVYELIGGSTSRSFRTIDNQVLKLFLNNPYYNLILSIHNDDFLGYLKELSKIQNGSLIIPTEVYTGKNNIVLGYKHSYVHGKTINKISGETRLDDFIDAIVELYADILLLENYRLRDIHDLNIIFLKLKKLQKWVFKIIDLDMARFTDEDERKFNIKKLNNVLFRSLFHLGLVRDVYITDKNVKQLYESMANQEIDLIDFLGYYREYIIKEYGECSKIKDLNKGLIIKDNPSLYK
ncbi:MAG: hypothetical protein J1F35_04495 [Erysipelotrichales bacterium]|nr:hypothetical protein [Erysipelotrichales bacterium]